MRYVKAEGDRKRYLKGLEPTRRGPVMTQYVNDMMYEKAEGDRQIYLWGLKRQTQREKKVKKTVAKQASRADTLTKDE